MAELRQKISFFILLGLLLTVFSSKNLFAQYYYVNGYSSTNDVMCNNTIYKIDLENKVILDSINFNIQGEFVDEKPSQINIGNRWRFLISLLTNGLSGKNSIPMENVNTYYFIVNRENFTITHQNSLPLRQVTEIKNITGDSLNLAWIDDSDNRGGFFRSKYIFNRFNNQFIEVERFDEDSEPEHEIIIGSYKNPYSFGLHNEMKYYYDFYGDSYVNIFSTQNDSDIVFEMNAGDFSQESIILGHSPENNFIYNFKLRFKLLSMYPPPESPDSIHNTVTIIDGSSFNIINTFELDPGNIYLAKELGQVDYINGYLVYYFARSDGYGRFDPAYLLIFDTRTNEASWLRVGWR